MPFADASFDAANTQHLTMNIEVKAGLYREVARVLKSGARFGVYDIVKGAGQEAIYPVPWACNASTNFLATPTLLDAAGFEVVTTRDMTAVARAVFESTLAKLAAEGLPQLGLHVLLPEVPTFARHVLRNLTDDRIADVELVARNR